MHDFLNATLISFAAMFPMIMAIGVNLIADGIHNKLALLVH